jgi:hypothetical protein
MVIRIALTAMGGQAACFFVTSPVPKIEMPVK